ncbi:hypothetical protein ACJ41O_014754 [Fusarium nematophilum]
MGAVEVALGACGTGPRAAEGGLQDYYADGG